jgi:outer membrane protein assembly factor BamB
MDGRYEGEIETAWPEGGLPPLYKQPIGGGYASFVIADGVAFTIEQRRGQEVAAAYDLETGREVWTRSWTADFRETLGGDGPRATPTWDEGRLFVLGAEGNLEVLEGATGEIVWERNILEDANAGNLTWGMSASPLIVDEKVVVLPGGSGGSSVIAYDKATGDILWKSLDDTQAYTSPILVTLAGERQILVVSARRAMGLSVDGGALLWDHPWVTNQGINVAQPLVLGEDRVFLSAGYGHGAEVVEILRDDAGMKARSVWSNTRMKNKFTSSVLHEGHIYGLDEAILACVDASTGDLKWKGGRYGYGQLVFASGHLVVLTERGEVALVKATPERHEEIAMFPAIEGKTWNHPAIGGGILLVRNANEMAAFRIAP